MGIWIVKDEWISDSIEKQEWQDEADYEVKAFAAKKAREAKEKLFSGLKFYVFKYHSKPDFTENEFKDLILLAGGEESLKMKDCDVVFSEHTFKQVNKDEDDKEEEEEEVKPVVTMKWAFDSLGDYQKKKYSDYEPPAPEEILRRKNRYQAIGDGKKRKF